jgi:hypothetical protein
MAVQNSDIQFRLTGGSGNSNEDASLGGVMSSTAWAGGTLHDLFDPVTGDENAASDVEYRCIFVRNNNGSDTWGPNIKAWLSAVTAGGADIAIGLDPAGVGNGATTGVPTTVANENTAPAGVTFTNPTTKAGSTLAPANVGPGAGFGLWIRRSATNSSQQSGDGATLSVEGDVL